MPQLLEQHDFTVVGVLGFQGVGKSRLMSLLAGAGWAEEPAPDRADATTAPPPAGALHDPPFAPQTRETVLRGAHQTSGVEVLATSERLILLDTQPLLSPSALVELLGSRGGSGAPLPPDVQSHENLLELQSLRLALFVLSVCHVVIFVHDQPLDARWCRFVRAAHMLRHQLPDLSTVAGAARGAAAAATAAAAAAASAAAAAAAAGGEKPAAALAGLPAEAAPVLTYAPTVAIALTRAPLAAFGSRPKLRRALGQLLHAPAQPPTAAEAAAAAVAVADGAADDEPAPGQPLLFLLPPPEHEAVTSPSTSATAPSAKPSATASSRRGGAPSPSPSPNASGSAAPAASGSSSSPRPASPSSTARNRSSTRTLETLESTRPTSLIYDDLVRPLRDRTRRDDDDASRGCTDSRHSRQCSLRAIRRERRADAGRRPPTTLLFSLPRSLFSPALKPHTTGAPPPAPLPPPHPPLPCPAGKLPGGPPNPWGPALQTQPTRHAPPGAAARQP